METSVVIIIYDLRDLWSIEKQNEVLIAFWTLIAQNHIVRKIFRKTKLISLGIE
jgi:hypothetical protein